MEKTEVDTAGVSLGFLLLVSRRCIFSYASNFSVCSLSSGMVYSSKTKTSRHVYIGVLAVGASDEGYLYPEWVAA